MYNVSRNYLNILFFVLSTKQYRQRTQLEVRKLDVPLTLPLGMILKFLFPISSFLHFDDKSIYVSFFLRFLSVLKFGKVHIFWNILSRHCQFNFTIRCGYFRIDADTCRAMRTKNNKELPNYILMKADFTQSPLEAKLTMPWISRIKT